jgi:hypothetical protein
MPGDFIPSILKGFKAASLVTIGKGELDVITSSLEQALAAIGETPVANRNRIAHAA